MALGPQTYRVERPFGGLRPAQGSVTDVAVDAGGNVHVLVRRDGLVDGDDKAVFVFDPAGEPIGAWGDDLVMDAHMLAPGRDGILFVVDRDAHEVILCRDGRRVGGIGGRHRPNEPFNHPTDVAQAADGTLYVADGYANARIHRFAPDGALLQRWGSQGDGPGQFMTPHAVWVMRDGRVVVADRENNRLQVFSADGALLDIWHGFEKPMDIWGDDDDRLYVTDLVPSLTLLSPAGERLGRCRPVLNVAHGIWGGPDGSLYLAEPNPNRVTKLVPIDASSP
ncbi:6-bladed beta-propeller [Labrys monachus]|uniref:Peptidylglycine monooxygenase n=1 Tax=Labrys monachus TaxID=217067 RepID=A0ABU0FJA8_9HYPH|nr:6-bladed beta-propeller [Labrys monachus]MDQ0394427.1 peptidylglycine monooxygenase [Labrys monachus]